MYTKQKAILVAVSLLVAFAFGYWIAPEKVKIEKQVVEVEKKTEKTNEKQHSDTTTVEVTKPDGTKETTTHTIVDNTTHNTVSDDTSKSETDTKEVTKSSSRLNIYGLVGLDVSSKTITYGAHVSRNIIGPITMGAFGLTDGVVGLSVGLTF